MDTESLDNVALIGFMGAGKSAVGYLLAGGLKMEFIDLDAQVACDAGMSINEIFASEGEGGFRKRESAALISSVRGGGKVISCGGGIVLDPENIDILRDNCRVFLLHITPERAVERLGEADDRPLIAEGNLEVRIRALMKERNERYLEAAHEVVEADVASPQELAEEIAARWRRYRSSIPQGNIPFS